MCGAAVKFRRGKYRVFQVAPAAHRSFFDVEQSIWPLICSTAHPLFAGGLKSPKTPTALLWVWNLWNFQGCLYGNHPARPSIGLFNPMLHRLCFPALVPIWKHRLCHYIGLGECRPLYLIGSLNLGQYVGQQLFNEWKPVFGIKGFQVFLYLLPVVVYKVNNPTSYCRCHPVWCSLWSPAGVACVSFLLCHVSVVFEGKSMLFSLKSFTFTCESVAWGCYCFATTPNCPTSTPQIPGFQVPFSAAHRCMIAAPLLCHFLPCLKLCFPCSSFYQNLVNETPLLLRKFVFGLGSVYVCSHRAYLAKSATAFSSSFIMSLSPSAGACSIL